MFLLKQYDDLWKAQQDAAGAAGSSAAAGTDRRKGGRRYRDAAQSLDTAAFALLLESKGKADTDAKVDANWRAKVDAPLVEHAWETLCGSILQEVSSQVSVNFLVHGIRNMPQGSMWLRNCQYQSKALWTCPRAQT